MSTTHTVNALLTRARIELYNKGKLTLNIHLVFEKDPKEYRCDLSTADARHTIARLLYIAERNFFDDISRVPVSVEVDTDSNKIKLWHFLEPEAHGSIEFEG